MGIWLKSLGAGVLTAFIAYAITEKGKTTYTYKIDYDLKIERVLRKGQYLSQKSVEKIIEKRLKAAEFDYTINEKNDSFLHIIIDKVSDTVRPRILISTVNRLQFRSLYTLQHLLPFFKLADSLTRKASPDSMIKLVDHKKVQKSPGQLSGLLDSLGNIEDPGKSSNSLVSLISFSSPYNGDNGSLKYPPEIGKVRCKDTGVIGELLRSEKLSGFAPPDIVFCYRAASSTTSRSYYFPEDFVELYAIKLGLDWDKAELENEDLLSARADYDVQGKPEVLMQFNPIGTIKWKSMTEKNVDKSIAILIDNRVLIAPNVLSPIYDGKASISGNFTVEECVDLSRMLSAGAIPAKLTIINTKIKTRISPVIAKDLMAAFMVLIVFTGLAFFVFKILKSTPGTGPKGA